MANGPLPNELLAMLMGSTAYGDGADYLADDDSSPYGKIRNRAGLIKDIESMTGVPFIQLAGINPQAEEAPPSRVAAVYGSNPELAKAFQAIDAGTDPLTVRAAYEQSIADGLTPQSGQPGFVDADTFTKVVQEYAMEKAENPAGAGQTYTLADGSKAKNAPLGGTDIYGNAMEYDLWGAPSLDEMRQVVANDRTAFRNKQAGYRKAGTPAAPGRRAPGRITPEEMLDPNLLAGMRPLSVAEVNAGERSDEPKRVESKAYNRGRDAVLKRAQRTAQSNPVRSDANVASMQRLLALRTLLGG